MKKTTFKIIEAVIIFCFLLFLYGTLRKHSPSLTFGYGIGDWGFVFLYSCLFILQILVSRYGLREDKWFGILTILGVLIIVFLLLSLTVWRGGEYPLEKGFFYRYP